MHHLNRNILRDSVPGWQFISQGNTTAEHLFYIQLALEGGCRWVQLRLKGFSEPEIIKAGLEVYRLCEAYDATFILNDHVHLVDQVTAHGVHLGLSDMLIAEAKSLLNKHCIIGGTANTEADVASRIMQGVHYIGLGPFRFTRTKEQLSPVLGLQGYYRILKSENGMGQRNIPVFAIGGITSEDIPELLNCGVDGVAVSGWVTSMVALDEWQHLTGTLLTIENVVEQYNKWKISNAADAEKILSRIALLGKNTSVQTTPGLQ